MSRVRTVSALVALVVVTGCTGPTAPAAPSTATQAPGRQGTPAAIAPSSGPATSSDPTSAATGPAAVLGPSWALDGDGDGLPDAVEATIDTDPLVDECRQVPGCGERRPGGPDPFAVAEGGANTLLILDASGSMAGSAGGGGTKMRDAKRAVTSYVVGLPDYVAAGLLVYGHVGSNEEADKARSCAGVERFAELGELTHETVDRTIDRFRPVGWTPIAGALDAAADEFAGVSDEADNRVILVSDGIETCDGDPVAAARRLARADVAVTVDVVGFDVDAQAARQLERVADVTGGTYTDARSAAQLRSYFERERERIQALSREYRCAIRNRNRITSCYARTRNRAERELSRLANTADDPARAAALLDVRSRIVSDVELLIAEVDAVAEDRIVDLERQGQRARRRWERRYRRSSAVPVLSCDAARYAASAERFRGAVV